MDMQFQHTVFSPLGMWGTSEQQNCKISVILSNIAYGNCFITLAVGYHILN